MAQNIDSSNSADTFVLASQHVERGELTEAKNLLLGLIEEGELTSERQVLSRTLLAEVCEGLGQYNEAAEVLSVYDVHALDPFTTYQRGLILLAFGSLAYWQNDFPRSVSLLNRSREYLEPTGDLAKVARANHCLGRTYWGMDEIELAREHYELSIEWGRRARADRALAGTYMNLGIAARHEGDLDEAGMCYRRALRLLRNTTDDVQKARLQNNLCVMHHFQGNFGEAEAACARALEHLSGHSNDLLRGMIYDNLALALLFKGEWPRAEEYVKQSIEIARASNDRLGEGRYLETLGSIRSHQGRVEEAGELLRLAVELAKEVGSKKDECAALLSLSKLWLAARNTHLALTYARDARQVACEINEERASSEAALLMVEAYRRSDKWSSASDWLKTAEREIEELPYPYLDAVLERTMASFLSRRRDPSRGERLFRQAEETFRSMGAAYQVALTIFEYGESLARRGDYRMAYERFSAAADQFRELGARLDAERAAGEAERVRSLVADSPVDVSHQVEIFTSELGPLLMQVMDAASGRERLLREVMFAARGALVARGAAVFASDDDGHLSLQASVGIDESERRSAQVAVDLYLDAAKHARQSDAEAEQLPEGVSQTPARPEEICRTIAPRRNGGAFVLYLRQPALLSERRSETLEALVRVARMALQMLDLKADVRRVRPFSSLASMPLSSGLFPGIITTSYSMRDVLARMERLKDSDATVLILGESGTGKELIARSLHEESQRRERIFLPFNCSAAPRDLVESQLFGHRRGAFTGAIDDQRGIIRAAEGGTLFLDEIGDLDLDAQPKLLRFLQGGEVMPLGEATEHVNVRVIAATNRNLEEDVREGRFREDLFYRLNTFVIKVPPLRERAEDIPLLASHYFEDACRRHKRRLAGITPEAMIYLARYRWPGNVRQLRSEIERIVMFARDDQPVGAESVSPDIVRASAASSSARFSFDFTQPIEFKELMMDVERQLLTEALARQNGNATRAAEMLGLRRQTFTYKLRRFDIDFIDTEAEGEGESGVRVKRSA